MPLTRIDAEAVDEVINNKNEPCLIVFSRENCHVCQEVVPRVEELAEKFVGKLLFYYIDVEDNKDILKKYALKGVPQILFFKGEEFCGRIAGNVEEEDIEEKITELL
ncbi:MAG: thioredoxin family protein [Clostridia bacterium]|jgi:thioredoxin 1|nr:thioredoxin family protein [Clostridia bacterium]